MAQEWEILWGSEAVETEEGDKFEFHCSDGYVRIAFIDPYNWNPYKPYDYTLLAIEKEYIPNWKTKEGQEMKVAEMTDSHYHNAVKFVQNRITKYSSNNKKHLVSRFWLGVLKTDPRFKEEE